LRAYEVLFIVSPDYEDEQIASIIARYKGVITKDEGVVTEADKWAKRRLTYEIAGFREGLYILMTFEGTPEIAAELDRLMKIDQEVLRHMISRIDDIAVRDVKRKKDEARTEEPRSERGSRSQGKPEVAVVDTKASKASEEARVEG
jgi:single-strand DNA-binding protein